MDNRIEIRPGRTINARLHQHKESPTTLFLIHGLGGRGAQWREQVAALKEKYTLVIPDLFGHGNSDKPTAGPTHPYQFSEFDQDLRAIFNKWRNEKNLVMGHSYGGALAASLAIDHQDAIQQLILITPLPCTPMPSPLVYQLPSFLLEWLRPTLEKRFQKLAFDPNTQESLLREESLQGKVNPMYVIKAMVNDLKTLPQLDMTMLTLPTLMIHGDKDGIVPLNAQQQFYSALPHHRAATIAHASHMVMLEKPKEVNAAIHDYLAPNN